ncbi:MAG: DNA polymerase I [Tatlockia sp.]|jgi:DNA polymerase-1
MSPLILIDGSSYFFRAFHALPPLTNSKGQPTGAIYGVVNMVKRLIKDYQPEHIAVVFDTKGKTFREEWYPQYKAHRPPMPQELSSQFQPLMQFLAAMGLPLLLIEGVEADDVIGTLTHQAVERGQSVVISTSDKDMAQLVNEHVTLVNTMTNQTLDIAGVTAKFGVTPSQMIDYLTLVGDSVDNIPGVTKCGPKTAAKWLLQYQTLDNLIADSEAITGKIGEYLRASLTHLPLSKKLVQIKTDVELTHDVDSLKPQPLDSTKLIELTREFEFKNWLQDLLRQEESQSIETPPPFAFDCITTKNALARWVRTAEQHAAFCLSAMTTHANAMEAELVGIALGVAGEKPAYLPLMHQDGSEQIDKKTLLDALTPLFENLAICKIGHDLKHQMNVFKRYGLALKGAIFDTMLESYVLNSNASRHDLATLSLKYLGQKTQPFEAIAGKGAKQLRIDKLSVATVAPYAAKEVDTILQLHHSLYPMLDPKLNNLLHSIELPLCPILADMEYEGVLIDKNTLVIHGERLKIRIRALEEEAVALAGKSFNLNSPKQLQDILFTEQNIPVIAKTPTGQPSTAESVLQELAFDYRLPAVILEFRSLSKLVSTYIDALPKCIIQETRRVHTCYNQAVAATGRLSSSDPNLQNIPIRSEEGRLIRKAFIAPPHHVLLAADYSQIELRIMAHLSQDQNLLMAFSKGLDVHTATASEIFQVPLNEVDHEQRRRAKAVNFGLIYGMSSFGLAKQLGIERHDAQFYMDTYFKRYPGVLAYMETTRKLAHEQGFVETLFGRRLHLPEINAQNTMRRKAAERAAINAPMQGSAADIIKKAMIKIAQWQKNQENPGIKMIMQVHDELIFEVPEHAVDWAIPQIRALMESAASLDVPLEVSIGVGKNWDEAH